MCSIAGAFWFDSSSKPDIDKLNYLVKSALEVLINRGPDESSISEVSNNCVIGGNRLIIRGCPGSGSMPFRYNKNRLFYNGEIYNYKSWDSKAASDGEVILPLFDQYQYSVFEKLDGEFAIALWDDDSKTLILARDQFGTKPLYFSLDEHRLLFASSASAINRIEKHDFCQTVKGPTYKHSYAVQEPYTSYRGIWQIPPGHFLITNKNGANLFCYNQWPEYQGTTSNTKECFDTLKNSLMSRMDYEQTIGIPMSGGIDSGIIAFMAEKMNKKYQIFSVIEIFGQRTDEADSIEERINRLKKPEKVNLIKFGENEYLKALEEIFLDDYYDSEKFDNGNLLMHAVFDTMNANNIRVAIDGSGGDELFHGYKFHDDFKPVSGWPKPWKKTKYFYSLYTTLLDYTAKSDRAGAHFSIEARYPFQNVNLMKAALKLTNSEKLKWPLRKFLLEEVEYGQPLDIDVNGKFGFSIKNKDKVKMIQDMTESWCKERGIKSLPKTKPLEFPFAMNRQYKEF